jgi:hypothetical protein
MVTHRHSFFSYSLHIFEIYHAQVCLTDEKWLVEKKVISCLFSFNYISEFRKTLINLAFKVCNTRCQVRLDRIACWGTFFMFSIFCDLVLSCWYCMCFLPMCVQEGLLWQNISSRCEMSGKRN